MTTLDKIEERYTDAYLGELADRSGDYSVPDDIRALLAVARAAERLDALWTSIPVEPSDAEGPAFEDFEVNYRSLRTALANLTKENQGT